ncbi:MAG: TonB-dependent siderophore receptor [Proteobacteria bacterium]|nr:TonB-dependent siderophore receptor [Pseudomonadota bacterium]
MPATSSCHRFDNSLTFRQNARYSHVGLDYKEVYGASTDPTANPTYCGLSCVSPAPYVSWRVKQSAAGVYAQDELTLFDKLTLTGGLRYDYVDSAADYLDKGTSDHKLADGTDNPLQGLIKRIPDAGGTSLQSQRKVCCLRYLVPGVGGCGATCPLPQGRR